MKHINRLLLVAVVLLAPSLSHAASRWYFMVREDKRLQERHNIQFFRDRA